jgi:hypothetical protein
LEVRDNVDDADPPLVIDRLDGDTVAMTLFVDVTVRATVPANCSILDTATVAVVGEPAALETVDGLMDIEKSLTRTVTTVDLVNVPFEAETVTA